VRARKQGRQGFAAWAAVLVASVIAASCGTSPPEAADNSTTTASVPLGTTAGPEDVSEEPTLGGSLIVGIEAEPEGLDPTRYAFSSSGHFVASAVYDPLVTLDENAQPVPVLAESIESNEDATVWTIKVRRGVVFHDGTPLTAEIVADNLEAYRNSFITKASLTQIDAIEATGPFEVQVRLAKPFRSFPSALATQIGYIVAPAMLKDPEMKDEPVGTGPFMFENHVPKESWSFVRNPNYWQPGLPYLDEIEFRPIVDNAERTSALDAGDIDVLMTREPHAIEELRQSDFKLVENSSGEEEFIVLNTTEPPFDSATARRAVAYATDRQTWSEEVTDGLSPPVDSPFAPGQPGYLEDNDFPDYDLEKARQLVHQYEVETGHPLRFTWLTQADTNVIGESQLLEAMFEDAGMEVTVEAMPQINLIAQIAAGQYQMGRFRLFGQPNPDPDAIAFLASSAILPPPDVALNFPRFDNDTIDDAIATALATEDPEIRQEAYATVNRVLAVEVPYIWLGRTLWVMAANQQVNGIYEAENGTIETLGPKTWLGEVWISRGE
jgi:peptide/nickel transport system substrate-binding protein